jgi:hypothetical protein
VVSTYGMSVTEFDVAPGSIANGEDYSFALYGGQYVTTQNGFDVPTSVFYDRW